MSLYFKFVLSSIDSCLFGEWKTILNKVKLKLECT